MKCPVVFFLLLYQLSGVVNCDSVLDNIHYMGCFDPSYSLLQRYLHHIVPLTLDACFRKCISLRTNYAGLEASENFCFCGGDIAEESIKRNDSLCNVPCPRRVLQTCGGDWLMSLYDIKRAVPSDGVQDLGFLIGTSIGVRLYHANNFDNYDTIVASSDWVYSVDYHFAKKLVFIYSKGKIYRTRMEPKLSPNQNETTMVKAVSGCDAFAVDWEHDRIYFANCSDGLVRIMSMDLNGGDVTTLVIRNDGPVAIKRMEVDPYQGMLFWTADGTIESCELSGDNFQRNVSGAGISVRVLTLDLKAQRVYYVGAANSSVSLFSMDYEGDADQEHFSLSQLRSVYGLGLLKGWLYWVNYANVRDVIYKAPVSLNGTTDVVLLKPIDRAVWHMRVVHPDMQKRPRRDPCEAKGCTHFCVPQSTTSAHCQCPEGQALNADGVSCSILPSHKQVAVAVAGKPLQVVYVVLLVAAVVFLSAGLLYTADRCWPILQTKLGVVPYTRQTTVTPAYDTSDDNVNLV